jgi:EmrB/QacA subfamily drug resistance transporter
MSGTATPSPTRWWTLLVVAVGTFMLLLDLSVVSIALPQIHASLHTSFAELQWVFDAYALTLAVFLVTAGSLADRLGRRVLFQTGFAVFTAASLACALSQTAAELNVARGAQGVGAAILFAVGPAMLGFEFHGKERATAFSVFGAAGGLAIAVGPLLGGALTSGFSWRWIFAINVPVGVLAMALTALRVRESRARSPHAVDWGGMLAFTVALGAIVYAIIRGDSLGWTSATMVGLYAGSAAFLAVFVLIERARGESAMFDLALFRNPTFVGISLVALIANGAGLPSVFIETNYVENILHLSAWGTGLRFLPLTVALFVFAAVAGGLTGKVSFRALMGASCLILGAGLLLTQLAHVGSSWTALIPSLVVTGAGLGIFNPTRAALAIGVTEPAKAGVASGVNETFQQVGAAIGIAGIGALFQNRVTASFTASAAGQAMGPDAHSAGQAIGSGSLDQVAASAGTLSAQVLADGRNAFIGAFHDGMTLCAVFAFAAAAIALALLRTKDLHATALSLIPPDVEDDAEQVDQPAVAV